MDLELSQEQEMVRAQVRKFCDGEIFPIVRDYDRCEEFPRDLFQKMASLGLLGAPILREYGGAGLDPIGFAIVMEEVGRVCSALRSALSVQTALVGLSILQWGTEEQRRRYLPGLCQGELIGCFGLTEPNAGSDAAAQQTTAILDGSHWVINGIKVFITNGSIAHLALIFARTDRSASVGKAREGMAAFLIEKGAGGFSAKAVKGKLGLRASDVAELNFTDCHAPKEALLGQIGEGLHVAMSALDHGRYSVAAGCVGIIDACLEASIQYAKGRRQFGKPIGEFQLVQEMIARMSVDLEAARLLVYRVGQLRQKGHRATLETSQAKYFASEAAVRAAADAVQIHGAYGYVDESPVERYYRDAKATTIYEGTSQIQKLIIGSHLLGMKAFV
jgi:alkylation response protein AidB-like acyl-CoA dehydrogenase